MNDESITVVLNLFRRIKYLKIQLNALKTQTVRPKQIFIWHNAHDKVPIKLINKVNYVQSNKNLGVWARFSYALNVSTKYVCIIDDDTIPGKKWLENCLLTIKNHEGLLGTRGVRFMSKKRYYPVECVGWENPNNQVERVDIVGHSWFFKREWLSTFWRELPHKNISKFAGEDIHFSYTLQKYLNINTFVPPHPVNDKELWGSLPEFSKKLGADKVALSLSSESTSRFSNALKHYCEHGFELCLTSRQRILKSGLVIGTGVQASLHLRLWLERFPKVFKIARKFLRLLNKFKIYI
jgi:hypothetical protein